MGIFTGTKHATITGRYDVSAEEREKVLAYLKIPIAGFITRQASLAGV
ncbi:MAG: hypothetical protein LBH96_01965 [Candidatus Peribacteria bacterium]|nr:hypothetical protein [Candidatus Peribacteria bacterium]